MNWIEEMWFLLFGSGETWWELLRGFGLMAVVLGMGFLAHRWMSHDLKRKLK